MPSVYLDDGELIELILERPHVIAAAIDQLQTALSDERELWYKLYGTTTKLRQRVKELEAGTGEP